MQSDATLKLLVVDLGIEAERLTPVDYVKFPRILHFKMHVKIELDKGLKTFAFGVSPPTRVTDLQIGPFQGVRFLQSSCSSTQQQEYDRLRFLKSSA